MRTTTVLALSVALFLLCACGGGGGGGSSASNTGFNSPSGIQQFSVQRGLVQQSLALISATSVLNGGGGLGPGFTNLIFSKTRRGAPAAHRLQVGTCNNGFESSSTTISATSSSVTAEYFYDAACTEPQSLGQFTISTTGSTGFSLTGNVTLYTIAGVVDGYNTVSISFNVPTPDSETYVLQATDATSQSSSPFANLAGNCSITGQTGAQTCSIAVDVHATALNADYGVVESEATSLSNSSLTTFIETFTGTGSAYVGALNATNVVQQGSSGWAITGGASVGSANLSGTYTVTSTSFVQNVAFTINDNVNGGTVTVTYNPTSQAYSGTLTANSGGGTLATFTVDATGSGTVTYSNGMSSTVSDGVITS